MSNLTLESPLVQTGSEQQAIDQMQVWRSLAEQTNDRLQSLQKRAGLAQVDVTPSYSQESMTQFATQTVDLSQQATQRSLRILELAHRGLTQLQTL